jgi:hypothetical protein
MNTVFLYIYLTFVPPEVELARVIEVNLPMANIEFCETARQDLMVNIDAIFDYEGDSIHIETKCVDLAEWLDEGESLIKIPEEIEGVRG